MNSDQGSGIKPADLDSDFSADLETWINNSIWDLDAGINDDDNPNYLSQPLMPIADDGINIGEGSSNVPQFEIPQQMMTSNSGMTPGSSIGPVPGSGHNILSSAIKTLSNHTAESSQSHITNFNQYQTQQPIQIQTHHNQPLQPTQSYHNQPPMQQGFTNNYVQQPQTHSFTSQSNITSDDQMTNPFKYQMLSNQLLPRTVQMVNHTQTGSVQVDHTPWVQMQQNLVQNPLPSQQVTRALNDLISLREQQQQQKSINGLCDLTVPVGFATPQQFSSSDEYREYVVRQLIPVMRERYYLKLQQMLRDEKQRYAQARTMEDLQNPKSKITYLETMIRFLSITKADSISGNDQTVCNYMNVLVNFMANYMGGRSGGSSQNYEPHKSFNAPSVQLSNQSQKATNVETNMVNLNQNFNSRLPVTQLSGMPSSPNNTSFQIGKGRRPGNPVRIGPSMVSPSNAMIPKQQTNLGPNTSSVIGSGSPIGFLSNQAAANLPSQPCNKQPRVLNSEKMKQPMQPAHKKKELTNTRARAGLSPLGSRLVNHYPPNQSLVPSSVNPISQQTSVTSETFDVNSILTPQAIARSPFLLSSSSTPPSGKSIMTTVENQKLAVPTGTPCQEPQTSKDPIQHLCQVVKSVSPKALSSSLTDISLMESEENIIPDCMPTKLVGEYINNDTDNETRPNMRREVSIPSVLNHQLDLAEGNIYSTTTSNSRPKLVNEWALMEEIKEINSKLMETIVYEVLDPSKDNITLVGGHDGVILKCLFRNVCFPDLLGPSESNSSEKTSEFAILFLVPFDYPVSSTRVFKSEQDMFRCEVRWKLYDEMLTRFNTATRGIRGKLSVKELASNWDASASAVMSAFSQRMGGKSFSYWYGTWESCLNGSSGSNMQN